VTLAGRRVLLGVSGGIACYKSCTIARQLAEAGAAVDVVLTPAAAEFIRPVTFEALTGRPVLTSLWQPGHALAHVHLARDAELAVVAPATANLMARLAQGVADDLLTALMLARAGPVLLAPAMNDRMYAHPATQQNLAALESRGWQVIGPAIGALAEGPSDQPGRMSEPEEIVAHVERLLRAPRSRFTGRRLVVTAGPTREPLDPVRVLSNRSSGRMGYALAAAGFARGADVVLISGPTTLRPPVGVTLVPVENTDDMARAVARHLKRAHALVMAAAPADYRPARPATTKRPRGSGDLTLELEPTVDILATTAKARPRTLVAVGFALETDGQLERARQKLAEKDLDLIVHNDATEPGAGFDVETNRVTLLRRDGGTLELPLMGKRQVAERILDEMEGML
jgi:phosphopantothenoylcysteine decarboxylase/phosphopantothenate--cysteine ligase